MKKHSKPTQKNWALRLNDKVTVSSGIYPIDQFGKMGRIHSIFERSFNLKIGEQLINIASYEDYLSSFGMYFPKPMFRQIYPLIHQGNLVKITNEKLTVYSSEGIQEIFIENPDIFSLQISEIKIQRPELKMLYKILKKEKLENQVGLVIDKPMKDVMTQMTKKSNENNPVDWQQIIRYLIGRGKGLTPSGDDILTAYLALLSVIGDQRAEALASALTNTELSTTDVSKGYIFSAIRGNVNSLVYQLFVDLQNQMEEAIIHTDVKKIMSIGHSSGKDMCFGLLLALHSIVENSEDETEEK